MHKGASIAIVSRAKRDNQILLEKFFIQLSKRLLHRWQCLYPSSSSRHRLHGRFSMNAAQSTILNPFLVGTLMLQKPSKNLNHPARSSPHRILYTLTYFFIVFLHTFFYPRSIFLLLSPTIKLNNRSYHPLYMFPIFPLWPVGRQHA